jgi:hypothetical protein
MHRAKGKITNLITKPDRVLAARVEHALRYGEPLDQLSSNKDVLPPSQRPKPETYARRAEEHKERKRAVAGLKGAAREKYREELAKKAGEEKKRKMEQRKKQRNRRGM